MAPNNEVDSAQKERTDRNERVRGRASEFDDAVTLERVHETPRRKNGAVPKYAILVSNSEINSAQKERTGRKEHAWEMAATKSGGGAGTGEAKARPCRGYEKDTYDPAETHHSSLSEEVHFNDTETEYECSVDSDEYLGKDQQQVQLCSWFHLGPC